jgi:hypothetical protein
MNGEKEAACQKICGDAATRGVHFMGCPILADIWLGKRKSLPRKPLQKLETKPAEAPKK